MRRVNNIVTGSLAAGILVAGSATPEAFPERESASVVEGYDAIGEHPGEGPFPWSIEHRDGDCSILALRIGGEAVNQAEIEIDRRELFAESLRFVLHYSRWGDADDQRISRSLSRIEDRELSLVTNDTLHSTLTSGPSNRGDHIATQVSFLQRQPDGSRPNRVDALVSLGCVTATEISDTETTHTVTVPNL